MGESGFYATSADAGRSFEVGEDAPPVSLHDVSFDSEGRGFAVGLRGAIFRTDSAGRRFEAVHPVPGS